MVKKMLALAIALALLAGCSKEGKPTTSTNIHPRFQIVNDNSDIAFDTQTGMLCRTWDWHLEQDEVPKMFADANAAERYRQLRSASYRPLCEKIYTGEYPVDIPSKPSILSALSGQNEKRQPKQKEPKVEKVVVVYPDGRCILIPKSNLAVAKGLGAKVTTKEDSRCKKLEMPYGEE